MFCSSSGIPKITPVPWHVCLRLFATSQFSKPGSRGTMWETPKNFCVESFVPSSSEVPIATPAPGMLNCCLRTCFVLENIFVNLDVVRRTKNNDLGWRAFLSFEHLKLGREKSYDVFYCKQELLFKNVPRMLHEWELRNGEHFELVFGPPEPSKAYIDDFGVSTFILEKNVVVKIRWE
jgi:hypothetical protein